MAKVRAIDVYNDVLLLWFNQSGLLAHTRCRHEDYIIALELSRAKTRFAGHFYVKRTNMLTKRKRNHLRCLYMRTHAHFQWCGQWYALFLRNFVYKTENMQKKACTFHEVYWTNRTWKAEGAKCDCLAACARSVMITIIFWLTDWPNWKCGLKTCQHHLCRIHTTNRLSKSG